MTVESRTSSKPGLLTVAQAATYLAICKDKLYQLVRRGHLRCIKIGRSTRFRPKDLEAFIEASYGP